MSLSNSRSSLAALTALLLSGCATVGPNFAQPKAPAASGYAMAGDTAPTSVAITQGDGAAGQWWKGLGSADLDRTMRQALAGSPTLDRADATLAAAEAVAAATGGRLGPEGKLNASVNESRINLAAFGFTTFPNPTVSLYSVGGTVSYDLDLFGGRKREVEGAQARAEAEGYRAGAAYLTLTGDIALQAVEIAALRAQIAAVQGVIADDQSNLDLVRKALAAGSAPPAAQVNVRAQIAEDQALLPPLTKSLGQARHALALLVGRTPSDWTAPDFDLTDLKTPPSIPVNVPSQLARRRPDVLAAEADLHAATADIGVQTAKLYPDISLNAGLTQTALTPDKLLQYGFSGWNIGPGLSLPILGRDSLKSQTKAAEAQTRAALARYQITVLQAFGQVADALQDLSSDEAMMKAQDEAGTQARASLKNAQFAYSKGGGTLLEITDAQRSLNRARIAYAKAQGQRLSDVVHLYLATGADWSELGALRTASAN